MRDALMGQVAPAVLFGNACADALAAEMALGARVPEGARLGAQQLRTLHSREHLVVANKVNLEVRAAAGLQRAKQAPRHLRVPARPAERGHVLARMDPWWQCARCLVVANTASERRRGGGSFGGPWPLGQQRAAFAQRRHAEQTSRAKATPQKAKASGGEHPGRSRGPGNQGRGQKRGQLAVNCCTPSPLFLCFRLCFRREAAF